MRLIVDLCVKFVFVLFCLWTDANNPNSPKFIIEPECLMVLKTKKHYTG